MDELEKGNGSAAINSALQQATAPHSPELERGVETLSGYCDCEHQLITTKEELTEETSPTAYLQLIRKTSQLEGEAEEDDTFNNRQREYHEDTTSFREGYEYKLVDENIHRDEDMTCPLCRHIVCVPARVDCCDYVFCDACIIAHSKGQGSTCPHCDTKPFKWKTDMSLEHKIDHLQVHCINHDKGCRWTGDLRYAQQHLEKATDTAGTQKTSCFSSLSFWRGSCNTRVTVGRCDYQLTTCKKCEEELLYGELDHHSKNECKYRTIPCDFQFSGCDFESSEASMTEHIKQNTSKHLTLVTKHIQDSASNHQSLVTYWFPKILFASLIVIAFLLYTEHRLRATEMQFNSINRKLESIQLYYDGQIYNIKNSTDQKLKNIELCYNGQLHNIEMQLNSINRRLESTELAIEDASEELNRKVNSSELAIQSLQYNSRDIDSSLRYQNQKIKSLEENVRSLQFYQNEADTENWLMAKHREKMKNLESDVDSLKLKWLN